jgi:hypothetical protein
MEMDRAAFGFKFNALPNRWNNVTAPVSAVFRVNPAFLS